MSRGAFHMLAQAPFPGILIHVGPAQRSPMSSCLGLGSRLEGLLASVTVAPAGAVLRGGLGAHRGLFLPNTQPFCLSHSCSKNRWPFGAGGGGTCVEGLVGLGPQSDQTPGHSSPKPLGKSQFVDVL